MSYSGIDVSQWQGDIDFGKVKADGIDFVIIRAGIGRYSYQKDPYFEVNYKNAKAAGLKVGAYWYSYAMNANEARLEAAACIECIKDKQFEYPIFFDLEEPKQFNLGRNVCDSLVTTFCSALEKAGYFAGLYISRSPLQNYISSSVANKYALWIAEYGDKLNYSGSYGMWQNSSTWKVNGINGCVDHDYAYIDYPAIIKKLGLNGYNKIEPTEILDKNGFKKGDKNLGVLAYKQLLILAKKNNIIDQKVNNDSGFGDGTEIATNEALRYFGYIENGIAGINLIKKIGEVL
jgi:GH25 family lysozyme M1 (1,4-beta-N-acetylmuramidase)